MPNNKSLSNVALGALGCSFSWDFLLGNLKVVETANLNQDKGGYSFSPNKERVLLRWYFQGMRKYFKLLTPATLTPVRRSYLDLMLVTLRDSSSIHITSGSWSPPKCPPTVPEALCEMGPSPLALKALNYSCSHLLEWKPRKVFALLYRSVSKPVNQAGVIA
ncbi:hypothetical protein HJG60_009474 [Phyllostomus discolor]|uniref:Uncharacterized protein n=1 Tax=Phyllostomus discolor TaxID=89673 RepID=A0A833YLD7_9CHIR|nr:hypothetical protein HJG60_009474 [Phyllostomus discolor]